jgi:hypothetical protein
MDETTNRGGAPLGNKNAHTGSVIRGVIRRALAENEAEGRESLLLIAKKLIEDAEGGNLPAARELFDRIDGKPNQPVTGEDGGPISHSVVVSFV